MSRGYQSIALENLEGVIIGVYAMPLDFVGPFKTQHSNITDGLWEGELEYIMVRTVYYDKTNEIHVGKNMNSSTIYRQRDLPRREK